MKHLAGQAFRFSAIGVVNTGIGLCAIWLAMWLGVSPIASNAIGYTVGLVFSFCLNRSWTFRHSHQGGAKGRVLSDMGRFVGAFLVAWLLNIAIVSAGLKTTGVSPYLLQIAGMVTYTASFFVLCRVWVFRP